MKPTVKVCGMMRSEDVRMCIEYGTDTIGIVVDYPEPVPWNVDLTRAKELVMACGIAKSCIVTDGDTAKLVRLARTLQPDYMQVHFRGHFDDTACLVDQLKLCSKTKLVVTFTPATPLDEIVELSRLNLAALLHDMRIPGNTIVGGIADPRFFRKVQDSVNCPVILAGGLNSSNIKEMLELSKARMIDVMTGVEALPGIKDEKKVSALFRNLTMLYN